MRTFAQKQNQPPQKSSANLTRTHASAPSREAHALLHLHRTIGNQTVPQSPHAAPPNVHKVLASTGQRLDASARAFFEPRFGQDLSDVRIHADATAAESARSVNALAYTAGKHIVLGEGQYSPNSTAGQRLLAHELTHVMQQRSGATAMTLQRQANDPRKLQTVSVDAPRRVKVSEWLVESTPGGGSARTELYWVDFEVDSRGVLRASVRTVSPDRTYRSPTLRFGNEFRRALEHFADGGVEVTSFEGDWSYMSKDEISENLKVFREGLAKGMTREKAAAGTPTGKVLAASGFEVTDVENVPEQQEHLVEEGVRRWRVKATFRRPPSAPKTPPTTPGSGPGKEVSTTTPQELRGGPVEPVTAREVVVEPSTGTATGGARSASIARGGGRRGGSGGRGGVGVRGGRGGGFGFGAVALEIMYPERAKQAKAQAREDEIADKLARYDKQINDRVTELKPYVAKAQLTKNANEKVYVNVVYEVHHFEFSVDVYLKSVEVTTRNVNQKRRFSTVLPEKGWATGKEYMIRRDVDEHTYSLEVWVYSEAELQYFADLSDEYLKTHRRVAMPPYDQAAAERLAKLRKEIIDSFGPDVWILNL